MDGQIVIQTSEGRVAGSTGSPFFLYRFFFLWSLSCYSSLFGSGDDANILHQLLSNYIDEIQETPNQGKPI